MTYEPILRGAKITRTIVFLLAAFVLSVIIVSMSSRPTSAESLLYKVGCVVGGLLRYECAKSVEPATPSSTQSSEPSPGTTSPSSSSASESPTTTTPPSFGQATPAPITLNEELLEKLPDLPAVQGAATTYNSTAQFPSHVLHASSYGVGRAQQLATPAAIVASEEGWKVLGIAWYWWGLTIGVGAGVWYGLKLLFLKLRPSSV
jgi:hypothetical protein